MLQIYLPIAEISVNLLTIVLLGLLTGFLAGMFGIGGGFIATPLLIFIGIPPAISVATSTNQIIAASASGLLAHLKRGNVDIKMGSFLVIGGLIGSMAGLVVFRAFQKIGYIDIIIAFLYVIFLGSISFMMLRNNISRILDDKYGIKWKRDNKLSIGSKIIEYINCAPIKVHFPKSNIEISVFIPIIISIGIGVLVSLMGIGGGFLMIPAMLYILRMPSNVVVGTSLFQIIFIASNSTFLQVIYNNIDIVLSLLMIISSAIGAQIGSHSGYRFNADKMRSVLALMILAVCIKMIFVIFAKPDSLYSIEMLRR